jgi:lipopolysaccharide/colanic/teichoic acid biosynthesis glycosyltransferase
MGNLGLILKRVSDLFLSSLVLIITLPVFILAAIAIKIDSRGPVFFIQGRTGQGGKKFKMIKFRGMVNNALEIGPELTQQNDPRITRVGKFLRRTSIDEIPQFINVIKGEMSLVGPRPEITSITDKYNDEQRKIFRYKPGITGISQINGRQMLSPAERVKMESEYYGNTNFFSDCKVLLKTFSVVVTNKGNL